MPYKLSLGPLQLSFQLLGRRSTGRESVALTAVVSTPYSSATVENLVCDYGDLVTFRSRLRQFVLRADEGVAAMHLLMPMFDLALIATLQETVRAEVRLSSDIRSERHMFDFESSFEEAAEFAHGLDYILVSLPLGVTPA